MWSLVDVVLILINNNLSLAPVRVELKLCSELEVPVPKEEKVVPP